MTEIKKIKQAMIEALQETDEKGVVRGAYLCHEDVPEKLPEFDEHFTVVGENDKVGYLVMIQKIKF